MDQQSKPVEKEHIEKNMENSFVQKHVGKNRPRLGGQSGQGCRHHQILQSNLIPLSKAPNRQKHPDNQNYKKDNNIDGQQFV
jgi:hypothetical protein